MNVRVGDPFFSHEAVSVSPLVTPIVVCSSSLWAMVRPGFSDGTELSPFHSTLSGLATAGFKSPKILTHQKNRRLVAKLLREAALSPGALEVAETRARTAQALRDIAAELAIADPEAVLLVLPEDGSIVDHAGLEQAISLALPSVQKGSVVCFARDSVRPSSSKIWLEAADNLQILANVRTVDASCDPAEATARHADRNWFWNSGVYLVAARTLAGLDDINGRVEAMLLGQTERLVMVKLDAGWGTAKAAAPLAETAASVEVLASGQDFEVRRLTIPAGARVKLAAREGLSAHWTVVSGKANLRSGGALREVAAGSPLNLPGREAHMVENTTAAPLVLIEVQAQTSMGKAPLRKQAA
jgi:mannose-6-phosphate isomerase-like protein (cupin superfamily)